MVSAEQDDDTIDNQRPVCTICFQNIGKLSIEEYNQRQMLFDEKKILVRQNYFLHLYEENFESVPITMYEDKYIGVYDIEYIIRRDLGIDFNLQYKKYDGFHYLNLTDCLCNELRTLGLDIYMIDHGIPNAKFYYVWIQDFKEFYIKNIE